MEPEVLTRWIDPTIDDLRQAVELCEEQLKRSADEIERLKKKENDLIEAYRTAYKALQKKGVADDVVDYMMAQVDDCPTFTVEEPDYKRSYYEELDRRQTAIGFIDQVLQYHLNTTDKQIDEDINTLIGILAGFKGYHIKYKDINNMEYWRDMYYKLNEEYKEKIGAIRELSEQYDTLYEFDPQYNYEEEIEGEFSYTPSDFQSELLNIIDGDDDNGQKDV